MTPFNPLQTKIKDLYDRVLQDTLIIEPLTLEQMEKGQHGDTLLNFMVYEAADAADTAELVQMLRRAASQLDAVADLLSSK